MRNGNRTRQQTTDKYRRATGESSDSGEGKRSETFWTLVTMVQAGQRGRIPIEEGQVRWPWQKPFLPLEVRLEKLLLEALAVVDVAAHLQSFSLLVVDLLFSFLK